MSDQTTILVETATTVVVAEPDLTVLEVTPQSVLVSEGVAGPRGPQGLPGAGSYEYVQNSAVSNEIINHNMGRYVQTLIYTLGGVQVNCEVQQLNVNQTYVAFSTPMAYIAVIN